MIDIEKQLINYCSENPSFTLEEIEKKIGSNKINGQKISDFLEYCPLTFHGLSKAKVNNLISRHSFFSKMKFRIVLTDYEIENLVLIPGHRFIPFYFPDLYTHSFSIADSKTKNTLSQKKIEFKLSDLYEYYFFFNSETITDTILADDKFNANVVGKNPDGLVKITAFDLTELKVSSKLPQYNCVILEVIDWTKGIFKAELKNDLSPLDEEQSYIFAEEIETSLYRVFEKFGPYLDAPEQLGWAYFLSDTSKLKEPVISIEEALRLSEHIELKYFEDNTILWHKSDDASSWNKKQEHGNNQILSISLGKTSSIDAILDELGIPITSKELSLFMSVFVDEYPTFKIFIDRVLPANILFKDKAQKVVFFNHLEELFEKNQSSSIFLQLKSAKTSDFINKIARKLKDICKSYNTDKLSSNRSHEEASLAYRELKDQIDSLSSILSFCLQNHPSFTMEDISELDSYIENHFLIIEEIFARK